MPRPLTVFICLLMFAGPALAEVQDRQVEYTHDDTTMTGYFAWDDAVEGARPGVLVVHEYWGLNDYARRRARQLAELGYAAFAVDMYGQGRSTEHPQQAGEWATMLRENQQLWRQRALAGLEALKAQPEAEADRIAAVGYCFGGGTVLQLAYTGAPGLRGVVSLHGSFPVPTEEQAQQIEAQLLVHHGSQDKLTPADQIHNFQDRLDAANVDWRMVIHGGAKHSFTNPAADERATERVGYDPAADERSWADMTTFLENVLREPPSDDEAQAREPGEPAVDVDAAGRMTWNGQSVTGEQLDEHLNTLAGQPSPPTLHVSLSRQTPVLLMTRLLDQISAAGLTDVNLIRKAE